MGQTCGQVEGGGRATSGLIKSIDLAGPQSVRFDSVLSPSLSARVCLVLLAVRLPRRRRR